MGTSDPPSKHVHLNFIPEERAPPIPGSMESPPLMTMCPLADTRVSDPPFITAIRHGSSTLMKVKSRLAAVEFKWETSNSINFRPVDSDPAGAFQIREPRFTSVRFLEIAKGVTFTSLTNQASDNGVFNNSCSCRVMDAWNILSSSRFMTSVSSVNGCLDAESISTLGGPNVLISSPKWYY